MSHTCHRFWTCYKTNLHALLTFDKVHNPLRLPRETTSERLEVTRTCGVFYILTSKCASRHSTSQLPKVVRTPGVFYILTSTCASCHNGMHFFDISTAKSPDLVCFVHFDFDMCFVPQWRALFRHFNCQKSGPGVFCTFWLRNVLRATRACNCSSLIWPAGSLPTALASPLTGAKHWQNTVFPDFPTFSRACIFFLWLFLMTLSHDSFSWLFLMTLSYDSFLWLFLMTLSYDSFLWLFLMTLFLVFSSLFSLLSSLFSLLSSLFSPLFSSLLLSSPLFFLLFSNSSPPPLVFICPYCRKFGF